MDKKSLGGGRVGGPLEVITYMNEARDTRKRQIEEELHGIQIDELVQNAITPGSWYRENMRLAPETSSFWTALPRYIGDCIKAPVDMSPTLISLQREQAIQKYRTLFK